MAVAAAATFAPATIPLGGVGSQRVLLEVPALPMGGVLELEATVGQTGRPGDLFVILGSQTITLRLLERRPLLGLSLLGG